ncbi:DNA-protecting protein DprA [bacterium LRH843]|nr:DNA-protecting protein DprA [bacterium LRH843]
MNDLRKRMIHLHSLRGMNWKLFFKMISRDQSLQDIYQYSEHHLQNFFHMKPTKASTLFHDLRNSTPEQVYEYYSKRNIQLVTIIDPEYPEFLKEIYDPPFVLYTIGKQELLLSSKKLAVVGTRIPTEEGLCSVMQLIPPLIQHGYTIISGLAKGIDSSAHRVTINGGGQTIAVLGSGFDFIYPKENTKLFMHMAKHQLIISEYPPFTPPAKWQFPARNRIISGLSSAVLVIEAKEKSGSLITADQALEHGRDVFAVPGSIFQEQSIGTNKLIQQGAKLVMKAEDILNETTGLNLK